MHRLNKKKVNLGAFDKLIKALDRKISIKVGIIGSDAAQTHQDTDLTNAELGAIHEFGAAIPVTQKSKNFLHSLGIHLNDSTAELTIPTRSFLRMPILSTEGSREIKDVVKKTLGTTINTTDFKKDDLNKILDDTAFYIAETAYLRVLKAFEIGGFGNWAPITEATRQNRKYNPNTPPLTDTGDLRKSISYEIKETK